MELPDSKVAEALGVPFATTAPAADHDGVIITLKRARRLHRNGGGPPLGRGHRREGQAQEAGVDLHGGCLG